MYLRPTRYEYAMYTPKMGVGGGGVDSSAYASVLDKFWHVGIILHWLNRQGVTGPLGKNNISHVW